MSFVDLATGQELGRQPTGKAPHEIAISPDGKTAAVVAYGGKTIDLFDVASRTKLKTIDLAPNERPHGIVWLKDGRIVATTERSKSVVLVDPVAGKVVASIPTDQEATHMVAVTSDGRIAFTANIRSGTVSVVDLKQGRKLRDIAVGGEPEGIALSKEEQVHLGRRPQGRPGSGVRCGKPGQDRRSRNGAGADPRRREPRRSLDRHVERR